MIKRICKQCHKEYDTFPSINHFFCSHKCSVDWKRGRTWQELYKNASEMIKQRKGKRVSIKTEFKKGWQNTTEGQELIARRAKKISSKQSNAEKIAIRIIEENGLPFNFVGDGKLIIGTKNPDFIYFGEGRKIIEIFSDYWHREDIAKYWHQTEEGCILYYDIMDYNVLIIWEKELKNPEKVVAKIKEFMNTTLEFENVPKDVREKFLQLSKEEFDGNTGMCLKYLFDCFIHYQQIINTQDTKIDYMISLIKNIPTQKIEEEKKMPKMLQSNQKENENA